MRFVFAAAFVLVTALIVRPSTVVHGQASGPLAWRGCGGGFECATLVVPRDYDQPAAETISLALIRLPAADKARRIGSLFANPGGPGGSGIEFVRAWARSLDNGIRDRFDIVGWDPRGIGESTPIICHDNLQALTSADPAPDSAAEFDALAAEYRAFATACGARHGDLLAHLGTLDVARDLDGLRDAVGDEKLTYLGYSYGTEIGQAYAQLFPAKIRAIVLDGAVDLAQDPDQRALVQAAGFERALTNFLADCRKRDCIADHGDPGEAVKELLRRVDAGPLPARGVDRQAREGDVFLGLITPLYQRAAWDLLGRAIEEALDGDAGRLVKLADQYLGRHGDGTYGNEQEANFAVNCVDSGPSNLPTDWERFQREAARFATISPSFGAAVANGLTCANWPATPTPLGPVTGYAGPKLLVVSTTSDPATPYEWGANVAAQLGATLLTFGGDGHTAYTQDSCVDAIVDAYLIDLKLPASDPRCGNDEPIPAPVSVGGDTPTAPATPTPAQPQADAPTATPPAVLSPATNAGLEASRGQSRLVGTLLAGFGLVVVLIVAWAVVRPALRRGRR